MKVQTPLFSEVLDKLIKATDDDRNLSLDKLNELLPSDFPVEGMDDIFETLWRKGIAVIDDHSQRAIAIQTSRKKRDVEPAEDLLASPSRQYFEKLSRQKYLCPEAVEELSRLASSGDERARQELVSAYLPLVVQIARSYKASKLPFMELILAGNEGLVEAARHFDSASTASFSQTARWWIGRRLSRCVSENWQASRIPRSVSKKLRKMSGLIARYRGKHGRDPTLKLLARAMAISVDEILFLKSLFSTPVSLYSPAGSDGDGAVLADTIVDVNAADGATLAQSKAQRLQLELMLDNLSVIERRVICLRFGLNDRISRSIDEVATITGLSGDDVRGYEEKSLKRLRHMA